MNMNVTPTGRERRGRLLWARNEGAHLDEEWRMQAACRRPDVNPDWWTGDSRLDRRYAVWICKNACPVRRQCARWADANRPLVRDAVYGGIYWSSRKGYTQVRPCPVQPEPVDPRVMSPRCGTQAAVSRHRRCGQILDDACLAFDRDRKRAERRAAA